jgi:hypothetical protein
MVMGRRAKAEALFKLGQAVIVTTDGEQFRATVKKFKKSGKVRVIFDSGGEGTIPKEQLSPRLCATEGCNRHPQAQYEFCDVCLGINVVDAEAVEDDPAEDPEKKGGREMGFMQYKIRWQQPKKEGKKPKYFHVNDPEHDIRFYGWWRKTKVVNTDELRYNIDIFAKHAEHEYSVESISYETNPLKNIKSLEADICAAMNKFLYQTINGTAQSLETLEAKARFPVIKIKRMATIDRIILELKACRDTAIRAGGLRLVEIHGDNAESPTIRVFVDLTMQAMGFKGKIPSLEHGAMFDTAKKGERHGHKLTLQPSSKNVEDLVKQLKAAKDAGNKGLARKIRATLRSMGHRGGARSLDAKKKKKKKE